MTGATTWVRRRTREAAGFDAPAEQIAAAVGLGVGAFTVGGGVAVVTLLVGGWAPFATLLALGWGLGILLGAAALVGALRFVPAVDRAWPFGGGA